MKYASIRSGILMHEKLHRVLVRLTLKYVGKVQKIGAENICTKVFTYLPEGVDVIREP